MMKSITNTTVLSNFASVDQLDILRLLYTNIVITVEVYEEIQAGLEQGYDFYAGIEQIIYPFSEDGWIYLTSMGSVDELRMFRTLPSRLHYGEASCIAVAHHRNWLFLTDDRSARNHARQLGIPVSGTVGCLVLTVERGLCELEQANVWLEQMIQHGYYAPITDLSLLVQRTSN